MADLPDDGPNEATLIGARTVIPFNGSGDWVCTRPGHWMFAGTGMRAADRIPGLVGWEHHGDPADIPGLEVVAAGKTWTGPTAIAAPDAFKPAISFGTTGTLGVAWRTTAVNAYSVVSFDDGRTFSRPLQVNRATEPAGTRIEGGDKYSRITIDATYAYITWSDGRTGGDVDAIMSRVPLSLYR